MFLATAGTSQFVNQVRNNFPSIRPIISKVKRLASTEKKSKEKNKSMWEKPECCSEECESFRHDVLYLTEGKKQYTRTWVECEDPPKMKYVCVGEVLPPEVERRPRKAEMAKGKVRPCVGDQTRLGLMQCVSPPKLLGPCPRLKMPGCEAVRNPPKCVVAVHPSCCQKRCTLYPAYSECKKPKPKVKPPTECTCLRIPSVCEVFTLYRKFPMK